MEEADAFEVKTSPPPLDLHIQNAKELIEYLKGRVDRMPVESEENDKGIQLL